MFVFWICVFCYFELCVVLLCCFVYWLFIVCGDCLMCVVCLNCVVWCCFDLTLTFACLNYRWFFGGFIVLCNVLLVCLFWLIWFANLIILPCFVWFVVTYLLVFELCTFLWIILGLFDFVWLFIDWLLIVLLWCCFYWYVAFFFCLCLAGVCIVMFDCLL